MRTIILSMVLMIGTGLRSQNEYFQNNPVWQCTSSCMWNFPCVTNETYNYYINGDTLINSLTYKKIFKKGNGSYFWSSSNPPQSCSGYYTFIDSTPSFFLRSAGKQMYIYPIGGPEALLYDFNLTVGSMLPLTYNNMDPGISVTAIDSFNTPNGYYKRFALSGNTWCFYLIEGVGHDKGLSEPMQTPLECGYNLTCYGQNNSAYYPTSGPSCELMIGVPGKDDSRGITLGPNPFLDELFIDGLGTNEILSLYNILGDRVLYVPGKNDSSQWIHTGDLGPGIYLFILESGDRQISGKLLKQ